MADADVPRRTSASSSPWPVPSCEQLGYEVDDGVEAVGRRRALGYTAQDSAQRAVNVVRLRLVQERGRELRYVLRRKLGGPGMKRRPVQRAIKRVLDPVAAGVGLVVLSPLYAGLAVAVYLDSGRPVIFVSPRAGLEGRSFGMLKYRTMIPDAIARRPRAGDLPGPVRDRQGRSADHPAPAAGSAAPGWTSCRSSSTSSAGR